MLSALRSVIFKYSRHFTCGAPRQGFDMSEYVLNHEFSVGSSVYMTGAILPFVKSG